MNIAICDDEAVARQRVFNLVSAHEGADAWRIDTYSSGEELVAAFQTIGRFDIIFMDIEMNGLDGIDAMRLLHQQNCTTLTVFVTSHAHYVSDSLRFGGFQFMLKPITDEAFHATFEWALDTYRQRHTRYEVRWRDMHAVLYYGDILYLEARNRHLLVYTAATRYECIGKLSDEAKKLRPYGFVRCHQGFLVNMDYIQRIGKAELELQNGQIIPVSRQMRGHTLQTFNLYLAGRLV